MSEERVRLGFGWKGTTINPTYENITAATLGFGRKDLSIILARNVQEWMGTLYDGDEDCFVAQNAPRNDTEFQSLMRRGKWIGLAHIMTMVKTTFLSRARDLRAKYAIAMTQKVHPFTRKAHWYGQARFKATKKIASGKARPRNDTEFQSLMRRGK